MYYLGSKKKYSVVINDIINSRFGDTKVYVEPFAGGLNVIPFLDRQFERYCINDKNIDLYNLYISIRDDTYFEERLKELQSKHNSEFYYAMRSEYNITRESALLFYLLHTCYRSFYRIGSKGNFNCPCWRDSFVYDSVEFNVTREILKQSEITNVDWYELAVKMDLNKSLFVMDPPYDDVLEYYGPEFEDTKKLIGFCLNNNSILFNFNTVLNAYDNILDVKKFNDIIVLNGKMRFGADKPNAAKRVKKEIICVRCIDAK